MIMSSHSKLHDEEAYSAIERAYENDEWGRSQVDAEDPFFLQEQMHLLEKNRKAIAKIRERDEKFTPLRIIINTSSILVLLCGLAHIVSSGSFHFDTVKLQITVNVNFNSVSSQPS